MTVSTFAVGGSLDREGGAGGVARIRNNVVSGTVTAADPATLTITPHSGGARTLGVGRAKITRNGAPAAPGALLGCGAVGQFDVLHEVWSTVSATCK